MDTVDAGNKSDAIGKHFGFSLPKLTFEKTQQTENPYPGLDLNHSILVACDSNYTIMNCIIGSLIQVNRGISLNEGTILGSNDIYIGGQTVESKSAKLMQQGAIEMFLGIVLDSGAPLIGGAFASVSGGAGALAIPAIKTLGIALQIDGATKFAVGSAFSSSEKRSNSSNELKNVYNSIKESPNYPKDFEPVKNGTKKVNINNGEVYDKLRQVESGKWSKVYKDGYDSMGNKVSIHYFQSESGKVFDVKVKNYWSNPH